MIIAKGRGKLRKTAAMFHLRLAIGAGFGDQYGRTRRHRQFATAVFFRRTPASGKTRGTSFARLRLSGKGYRLAFVTQSTIGACHGHGNLGSKRA
jgi:hypothetical protein